MRLIKQFILLIVFAGVIFMIFMYFTLQSTFGARWISLWINEKTNYVVSIGKVHHSFTQPLQLTLEGITVGYDNQPALLTAQTAILNFKFSIRHLLSPQLSSLILAKGIINLGSSNNPFSRLLLDQLQLQNINIHWQNNQWNLLAQNVSADITPFTIQPQYLQDKTSRFILNASDILLNQFSFKDALIKGRLTNNQLQLTDFGADLLGGQITGQASKQKYQAWVIDNLRLSHIKWQFNQTLSQFWLSLQPDHNHFTIRRLDMVDSDLQGVDWAMHNLNLSVHHIDLVNGIWSSKTGWLDAYATTFKIKQQVLQEPLIKLRFHPNRMTIEQFYSGWHAGLLKAQGTWDYPENTLALNQLLLNSVNYTLPEHWMTEIASKTPSWLNNLTINQLILNNNQLTHVGKFPFQINQLSGDGRNLSLVNQQNIGLWQGNLTLSASEASLNQIDIQYPTIKLKATDKQLLINDSSALMQKGLLTMAGSIDPDQQNSLQLIISGQAINPAFLANWGIKNSLPDHDVERFKAKLSGDLHDVLHQHTTLTSNFTVD